tara:strand:- start:560 stop:982 length:423 start_codon:yes stop_codon:yes gene_type:complete
MAHPAQRLKQLIDSLGMNINSFSKECGYPSSATIWRIIDDNKKPSTPTINKICNRFTQVNREWLLTGLGTMFTTASTPSDDLTVTAKQVIDKLQPLLENDFNKLSSQIQEIHEKVTSIEFLEALIAVKTSKKEKNGNNTH